MEMITLWYSKFLEIIVGWFQFLQSLHNANYLFLHFLKFKNETLQEEILIPKVVRQIFIINFFYLVKNLSYFNEKL